MISAEIFLLHHAAWSQISPLPDAAGSQIFSLHFSARRCDSLLYLEGESNLIAAKCSG
jgi:hypothetical protein